MLRYFYNTFIFSYGGPWYDILLFYFKVMLYPQHFHRKS